MATLYDFHDASHVHPAASVSASLFSSVGHRVSARVSPATLYRKPGPQPQPPGGSTPVGPGGGSEGPIVGGTPPTGYRRPTPSGIGDSNTSSTTGGQQGTTGSAPADPIEELIALAAAMGSQGSGTAGSTVAVPIDSGTPAGPSDGSSASSSGKGVLVLVVLGFFIGIGYLGWKYRDKLFGKHAKAA